LQAGDRFRKPLARCRRRLPAPQIQQPYLWRHNCIAYLSMVQPKIKDSGIFRLKLCPTLLDNGGRAGGFSVN